MGPHPHPKLLFGSAILGSDVASNSFTEPDSVPKLLARLPSLGIVGIDTAARYPPGRSGESERLLGAGGVGNQDNIYVDTKVLLADADTRGTLTQENVRKSAAASLERLRTQHVHTLYVHAPDPQTPVEEQARALDEQVRNGMCAQLGFSNLSAAQIDEWMAVCDAHGYAKPRVYEGLYNLIRRDVEDALLPTLRRHGMTLNAFSPLAAGVLSGRLTRGDVAGVRFDGDGPVAAAVRGFYDRPETHAAVRHFLALLEPLGLSPTEAALRWLCYHSQLGPDDAIILGASRVEQLERNVLDIAKGPLPAAVVGGVDKMWAIIQKANESK